jgi:hypothetical protein
MELKLYEKPIAAEVNILRFLLFLTIASTRKPDKSSC